MNIVELMNKGIDIILHIDKYLGTIITQFGPLTYVFLFLIVFLETGLVFAPFLPGDSLLFAAGTLAGIGTLNIWILYAVFLGAAILGDTCNYWIGHFLGDKILKSKSSRFISKKHIDKTKEFFVKYGSETIIVARFMPIVRTFAPFMAGIGRMDYWKFLIYNVVGAVMWVSLFLFGGYYFGGLKFVQDHFSMVLIGIILLSFMPVIVHVVKEYLINRKNKKSK